MDRIDRHLLELLQKDGRLTTAELAEEVGLSASPCARRIKRLEEKGIIDGYRVSLSREKVGVAMSVFVEVSLNNHQEVSIDKFVGAIVGIEEVISCHVVSDGYGYLLDLDSFPSLRYADFLRELQPFLCVRT